MESWLAQRARRTPAVTAIETRELALTFGELAERVDGVARRLSARGAAAGARVAVLGEPTLRTLEIVHALQRTGAVLVPLNTRLTRGEIDALLACARPTLVLHDARNGALAPAGSIEMERELDATSPSSRPLRERIDPHEVHSIVFTSGTTGTPKAAMLTHEGHHASAIGSAQRLGTTSDDRWLLCMPLFHVGGLSIVLRSAITGFAIVLEERFDAARVNDAIHRRAVTTMSVVPTMLDRMLESAGGRPYPTTLRCALLGGAPLRPALHARACGAGIPVIPTYGLTEACSQVATAEPSTASRVEPGVGRPLQGMEVHIAEPDSAGVGEVLVRGPVVMRGYFENAPATRDALREHDESEEPRGPSAGPSAVTWRSRPGRAGSSGGVWLYTGDLGRLDPSGRLSIEGRRSDLIITGGENVMPQEVESVLAAHPDVADVAVFGVPDDRWGERVMAAVVPARDGVDGESLRAWCRGRLAGFKVPAAFVRVAALPRTPSGKLLRRNLRQV